MYDTLIIGRDLSSLIAALTSVRNGRKTVLILEENPEDVYRDAGYVFPLDPRPLSGMANPQLCSNLIRDLMPFDQDIVPVEALNPAFQIILPGHRVDIFADRGRLIDDLIREFPEQTTEIRRFYRAVERFGNLFGDWIAHEETARPGWIDRLLLRLLRLPAAISGHFSLLVQNLGKEVGFSRILQAQLNFLSHLEMDGHSFPLSAAYLLSLPKRGLFYPPGGMNEWTDCLRRVYTNHGGILKQGCSIIRIETEPEIAVDMKCEGSSTTLHGKKLIVSAQWEKLELLLPVQKVFPELKKRHASIRSVAYPFCLHMGIHEEGLPEMMATDVVVLQDGNGPVTSRELVFLHSSPPGNIDYAPEGRRALSATVYLPDSPLRLSDQELKNTATRIIESLEGFLPFLRESMDYLRVDQSILFSRSYQEIANRKYRTRRPQLIGLRTLSSRTRLRNVRLTGGILRAGLGFEGEILAGMDAALES